MKLMNYLQLVGRASGSDLASFVHDYQEEKLLDKLEELERDEVISVHTAGYGERYYRFPAFVKKEDFSIGQMVLDYIIANPGANGSQIKKGTGKSIAAVDERLQYLVRRGLIDKVQEGRSYRYTAVRKPSEISPMPKRRLKKSIEPS